MIYFDYAASFSDFDAFPFDMQLFGRPQWFTVKWRSRTYVNKVTQILHFEDKIKFSVAE